jgi:GNAT superfamily N-acetyltransferase
VPRAGPPRETRVTLDLCGEAEFAFARRVFRALGQDVESDERLWSTGAAVPNVFVQAGTRAPVTDGVAGRLNSLPGRALFRDTYASLDLVEHGFVEDSSETWMVRAPGPSQVGGVAGFRVERVTSEHTVALFERTTYANTGALDAYVAGSVHPPAPTLTESGLSLFIGFLNEQPVATAIVVGGGRVAGLQAVTVADAVRRQGLGRTMVASCLSLVPDAPVALSSTPTAVDLYRSIGFVEVGVARLWERGSA